MSSSLRIAYLMSYYPAVSHTFFRDEIAGLRREGIAVETLSINDADAISAAAEPEEQRRTRYIKSTPLPQALRTLMLACLLRPAAVLRGLRCALAVAPSSAYALFYWAEAILVAEHLRSRGLRSLHVHFGGPVATVGFIAAEAYGMRYSLTIHGPDEFFDAEHFALRKKFARAEYIFAISDFCRSRILRLLPADEWSKVRVVRLGVDVARFAPQPDAALQNTVPVIGCIGRLVPAKAQRLLLEAVAGLGLTCRVELVGDGGDRAALEAFAREHALSVNFHGALSHSAAESVLRRVNLFVLPSFAEGLPVALMESMALGKPTISTWVAGIPELITHEVDGLLVPAGNVEALRAAIARLLQEPDLAARLGVEARKKITANYDLARNIQLRARLLKDLEKPIS